jgi:hypothetical protein
VPSVLAGSGSATPEKTSWCNSCGSQSHMVSHVETRLTEPILAFPSLKRVYPLRDETTITPRGKIVLKLRNSSLEIRNDLKIRKWRKRESAFFTHLCD